MAKKLYGAAKRAHELKLVREDAQALADRHINLYKEITWWLGDLGSTSFYDQLVRELAEVSQ